MALGPPLALLLLVYAAFVSMGLPDGILGAAWPQMRAEFGVALNDNWPMLALGTCGSALSNFFSGFVLRRWGVGRVLLLTTFITASVILGYSRAGAFSSLTVLGFFLGLGNGAIDAGLNHFAAARLSSRHMNWLHACWGVGVSLGTLLLSAAIGFGGTWRNAYLVIALVQLGLGLAFVRSRHLLPRSHDGTAGEPSPQAAFLQTLRVPAAWASMAAFFVYCGLECATGLWIASVLHDGRGWSSHAAGFMTTLYWASLTVGRFLIGTISQRLNPRAILVGAVSGAMIGTGLIALSSRLASVGGLVTAFGLLVTGLSLSPIFPMLMHDTPRAVGPRHAVNLIGFQGACGQLGFALLPILVGTLLRAYSTEWLGPLLTGLATALLGLVLVRARLSVAHGDSIASSVSTSRAPRQ